MNTNNTIQLNTGHIYIEILLPDSTKTKFPFTNFTEGKEKHIWIVPLKFRIIFVY